MSLKQKAIQGVKWTTTSTVITTILQFLQFAILARFLEANDFGLMALTMIVIGFSQAFLDMGISNAIIQKQEVSKTQLSTLYWVNIISGIFLFLVIYLSSTFISNLFNEPKLIELITIVSLTFLIQPLGQQFMSILQKQMEFDVISKVDIVNKFTSLLISVYFAYMGYGVYALVYGTLAGVIIQTIIYIYIGFRNNPPSFVFNLREVKPFLSFGFYQMGDKSINYLGANIDKILIGKFIGMEALGFYNLAWQLIIFPIMKINPIINKVAFPLYSKVQNDKVLLSSYYNQSVKALTILTIPIMIYMSIFSAEIIEIVYGEGWELSAKILAILSFAGLLRAVGNPGGAIILALGRSDVGFWWNLFLSIFLTIILYLSILYSPDIIVISFSILFVYILTTIFWHRIVFIISKVEYKSIILHVFRISLVSLFIGYFSLFITNTLSLENAIFRIIASLFCCLLLYGVYLKIFEMSIIKQLLNKQKG